MSKATQQTVRSMSSPFANKAEAFVISDFMKQGKRTITRDEAAKQFGEASDALDVAFNRMEANFQAVAAAEVALVNESKKMIQRCKDYTAQVGDAMARIDKIVVKDFSSKLSELERFVDALERLEKLKSSGALDMFINAAKGK